MKTLDDASDITSEEIASFEDAETVDIKIPDNKRTKAEVVTYQNSPEFSNAYDALMGKNND